MPTRYQRPLLDDLVDQLAEVRRKLLDAEVVHAGELAAVPEAEAAGARNLVHYLALRRFDLRALQSRLASLGLSSLGRCEAQVLPNVDVVLAALHRLSGRAWEFATPPTTLSVDPTLPGDLEFRTAALLVPAR